MIFNVNAAAVAALALTMAVHAAPSGLVGHDLLGCDNDNDVRGADFGNHRDDVDRSAAIRVSVGDRDDDSRANSNRASDSSRQTDTNRASDESRRTDTNRANDDSRRTESNRASDDSRANSNRASDNSRAESNRVSESLVDAHIVTDSNRANDDSRRTESNRASDDSRANSNRASDDSRANSNRASDNSRTESNHASESLVDAHILTGSNRAGDESRRTDSNRASESLVHADILTTHRIADQSRITDDDCDDVVDARNRDARQTRDNSRCDDCTSEVRNAGGVLRRGVGALSLITHVLRVEHLTERCSPEESARRCGPDCNGFIGSWNDDKTLFDLFFVDKAIHGIPSELDVLLSKRRENVQYHYGC